MEEKIGLFARKCFIISGNLMNVFGFSRSTTGTMSQSLPSLARSANSEPEKPAEKSGSSLLSRQSLPALPSEGEDISNMLKKGKLLKIEQSHSLPIFIEIAIWKSSKNDEEKAKPRYDQPIARKSSSKLPVMS